MASITMEKQIGGWIVHLSGQFIGGEETDELRDKLKGLAIEDAKAVIIDMQKVTYLNSTALGVLISAHASFTKKGIKIILVNLGKSIENLFVITKLTLVFPIYESLEEAIKSIK